MATEPLPLPAIDLVSILQGIPRGAWVALSSGPEPERHVVAFGSDLRSVIEEAKNKGEKAPIVLRFPESEMSVML
jgi:hypothetical protein